MPMEMAEQAYQRIFEAVGNGMILNDLETGIVIEANPAASRLHGYERAAFVGLSATAYIAPHDHTQFTTWLKTAQSRNDFVGFVSHIRLDGSSFTAEVHGTTYDDGKRRYLLYAFHDVSTRLQSDLLLRQQIEERTREQSALLQISQTLASDLTLKPTLILDQLRIIIPYQHAVLFSLEGLELTALAVRGLSLIIPFCLTLADVGALDTLLNQARPQRIENVANDEVEAQSLRTLLHAESATLLTGVQSWMWIPLAVKGRAIGCIGVAHRNASAFSIHQANLALTMANQAAIAMVNTQLYEQARTLATVQERQRLAQNLHDAVNQSLFSAGLIAEVLPRLWEKNPAEGRKSLSDLRRLTRGALAEMRGLLAELQPQVLTDSALSELLSQLANAFIGRTNLPIIVNVSGQSPLQVVGVLPGEVQVAFYYLCQEALTNIAKHAKAREIVIDLLYSQTAVEIGVYDDGRGFDPANIPSGHYGLGMMRQRADAVAIDLAITSQLGVGSDIRMRWTEPASVARHK